MSDDTHAEKDVTGEWPVSMLTRREVLKLLGGGIVILVTSGDLIAGQRRRPEESLPEDFNAFLRIGKDGRVTLFTGKIEMGQARTRSPPEPGARPATTRTRSPVSPRSTSWPRRPERTRWRFG